MAKPIPQAPALRSLTFTAANNESGATDKYLILGDGSGLVQAALGLADAALITPTISGGQTYAKVRPTFSYDEVAVSTFKYKANTDAQFAQEIKIVTAERDNSTLTSQINTAEAESEGAFNDKLLTIRQPFAMTGKQALVIKVAAGNTVTLTLNVQQVGKAF